jgi:CheY-like chemotaxis protein
MNTKESNCKENNSQRILVVEDIELNQHLAKSIIEGWGFSVDIAVDGKKAVEMVQKHTYAIVLMDIQMPEMDGLDATRIIRKLSDECKRKIPIIALTANLLKGDTEKYLEAGMNDCLSKPIDETKLHAVVTKNLKRDIPVTIREAAKAIGATSAGNSQKLYDLSMIETISGGDEGFLKKMMQIFIDTMPQSMQEIQKELQQQEWEKVGKVAHKMKSTIDSMGIEQLKQDIRTIEQNGKKKEGLDMMKGLIDKVIGVLEQCIAQVRKDFAI